MNETGKIAANIVATRYEDLPREEVESTKKSILDTLGVMLPPSSLVETCAAIYAVMTEAGGKAESTIVGFGGKAPCWIAACINGSLTHAIDFDNCVGVEKPLVHPTGSSLPAALAVAEKVGQVSGKEFITAVALGDDLSTRLAACPKGNVVSDYPFFPITTFGVFAAAAVSTKLLRLSKAQTINALGLALNRVSGTRKGLFDNDLRAIRDSLNAREGILCGLFAQKGLRSCSDALGILFEVYYKNDVDMKPLTADLGKHFRGSEAGFKPWPSCQGTHSYIQAALELREKHQIVPEQIGEIVLRGNQEGRDLATPAKSKQNPESSITAKISLPFVVGVALAYGRVSITHFLPANLRDPVVLDIARKVRFALDPSLGSYSSRASIRTISGEIYHAAVDVLKGSLKNPLSREELISKFRDCARYSKKPLSAGKVERLISGILDLEKIEDIGEITAILK